MPRMLKFAVALCAAAAFAVAGATASASTDFLPGDGGGGCGVTPYKPYYSAGGIVASGYITCGIPYNYELCLQFFWTDYATWTNQNGGCLRGTGNYSMAVSWKAACRGPLYWRSRLRIWGNGFDIIDASGGTAQSPTGATYINC